MSSGLHEIFRLRGVDAAGDTVATVSLAQGWASGEGAHPPEWVWHYGLDDEVGPLVEEIRRGYQEHWPRRWRADECFLKGDSRLDPGEWNWYSIERVVAQMRAAGAAPERAWDYLGAGWLTARVQAAAEGKPLPPRTIVRVEKVVDQGRGFPSPCDDAVAARERGR